MGVMLNLETQLTRRNQLSKELRKSVPREDGRCKGPEAGRRLVFWRAREPVGLRKDGERERGGQGWRGTE